MRDPRLIQLDEAPLIRWFRHRMANEIWMGSPRLGVKRTDDGAVRLLVERDWRGSREVVGAIDLDPADVNALANILAEAADDSAEANVSRNEIATCCQGRNINCGTHWGRG